MSAVPASVPSASLLRSARELCGSLCSWNGLGAAGGGPYVARAKTVIDPPPTGSRASVGEAFIVTGMVPGAAREGAHMFP
jgi:hypothetical protein